MLDIEAEPANGNLYLVGTGGFYVLAPRNGRFASAGQLGDLWDGAGGTGGREVDFYEAEPFADRLIAISNRELGVSIIDATTPSQPRLRSSTALNGASGIAFSGNTMLVATYLGEVVAFDVTNPDAPQQVGAVSGLGNPWELIVVGDRAYVADNRHGLVVLDVSNASQPSLLTTITTAGGAQDIDEEGGHLYVAVGSVGIEIFDLANPDAPASVGLVQSGAAVVAVSAAGNIVWGATQEGLIAADVSTPSAPLPLAAQMTQEWAMNVFARGTTAYVADWSTMTSFELNTQVRAPEADVERSEVYFLDEPDPMGTPKQVQLRISNRGGADLVVSGGEIADPRFSLSLDRSTLPPGTAATFTLSFADDGQAVDTELCIATNDPDEPIYRVALKESSNTMTSTGESAPDFDLPDVDDDTIRYRLSEQLGKPVLLVYFATW